MQYKNLKSIGLALFCLWSGGINAQTVKDIDDNIYKTVNIGNQTWLAENLKTTRFNDGTSIPMVTNDNRWETLNSPAYCWYNNDPKANKDVYGALYNWYAVSTNKLCPSGWHVSSEADWTILINFLGGESVAGGKIKESGSTHWKSPNTGATNESGFTALPNGDRDNGYGNFSNLGLTGYFWTSPESSSSSASSRGVFYTGSSVGRGGNDKQNGWAVRCVKD